MLQGRQTLPGVKWMITEEIVRIKGKPKKLIVFLHGYIDSPEHIENHIDDMLKNLNDVAVHIPRAAMDCEIHPKKQQWFSVHRFDPDDKRKTVPSIEECEAIYDTMQDGIVEASRDINVYIDKCLKKYNLNSKDLYLCGYSQGAILAIFNGLMRKNIAGVVSFSGILAPTRFLKNNHNAKPKVLLMHGDNDNIIRYQALDRSEKHLKNIGCNVQKHTIPNGQHRIYEESMLKAASFING